MKMASISANDLSRFTVSIWPSSKAGKIKSSITLKISAHFSRQQYRDGATSTWPVRSLIRSKSCVIKAWSRALHFYRWMITTSTYFGQISLFDQLLPYISGFEWSWWHSGASNDPRAGAQRSLLIPVTLQSSVVVLNSLGLRCAVYGYEPRSPYSRVDAGSLGKPAKCGNYAMCLA